MKKFSVLLGTLALALGFGVAVGAHSAEEAKEAKATPASYTASVVVQKEDIDAKWDGCFVAAYMFDNDSHNAWGDKIANNSYAYQEYSWTVEFEPTTIILLRVPSTWSKDWENPWYEGEGGIYARTGNIILDSSSVVWMSGGAKEGSGWGTFNPDVVVKGGASDDWSVATVDTALTKVKVNSSNNLEVYGSVTLPAGTYFKTVKEKDTWCGTYSAHSSIQSNLSGGGESNIHNTDAATYEFYFDWISLSTYITDPVQAAADEYAQSFLSSVTCNGSAVTAPEGTWGSMKTAFNAMDADARSLLTNADANKDGSFIEQAVARYDLIIVRYGTTKYEDFMGRIAAGKLVAVSYNATELEVSGSAPIIIVVSAAVSLTAIGLVLVLRKKRSVK